MSYFAAAVVRDAEGWSASQVSLADAADIEDVADRLRDVRPEADISLLFVEAEDLYLVVLRLDQGEDLRVFGSDIAFAEESRLGAILLGDAGEPVLPNVDLDFTDVPDDQDPEEVGDSLPPSDADPSGDADLLTDLGVPAAALLEICAREGMLPADMTAEVCHALGCGDEVEELREA